MIPVWLQLVAAGSAGVISFLTGTVLIPFLEASRCCIPDATSNSDIQDSDTQSDSHAAPRMHSGTLPKLRPTMCGIALIAGTLAGLVISMTLYLECCHADRTTLSFQKENQILCLVLALALAEGFAGWFQDYLAVKRYGLRFADRKLSDCSLRMLLFVGSWLVCRLLPEQVLDFGFWKWDAGVLSAPVRALCIVICFHLMQLPEKATDGVSITVSAVQLLCTGIFLLSAKQNLYALLGLACAGACIGCLYWNLHPAKCRLGDTGLFWLGTLLPVLCILSGSMYPVMVSMTVYLVNFLPAVRFSSGWKPVCHPQSSLLMWLQQSGCAPLQQIAVLAGFALFGGIVMILAEKS